MDGESVDIDVFQSPWTGGRLKGDPDVVLRTLTRSIYLYTCIPVHVHARITHGLAAVA
jgi:hypothetical protein